MRGVGRNLLFLYLFNLVWALGNPMVHGTTMVVTYFDRLGATPLAIGGIQACMSLPVLVQFLPRLVPLRNGSGKVAMAAVYMLAGAGFIAFGYAATFGATNPDFFVPLLLGLYFLVYCLYQLGVILYLDYLVHLLPPEILGRFYGFNGVVMAVGALAGGALASRLRLVAAFPVDYGVMFMAAGGIFIVATVFSLFTRPVQENAPTPVQPGIHAYRAHLAGILRRPSARLFVALIVLIDLNLSASGFTLVFLNRELGRGIDPLTATMVAYGSQAVLLTVVGICMDRLGRQRTVRGYMALVLLADLAILLPWRGSHIFVFAVYGMLPLFVSMVLVRVVNEVVPVAERLDAMIVANVSGVVASSAASLLYGVAAGAAGTYRFVFVLSGIGILALFFVSARLEGEGRKTVGQVRYPAG